MAPCRLVCPIVEDRGSEGEREHGEHDSPAAEPPPQHRYGQRKPEQHVDEAGRARCGLVRPGETVSPFVQHGSERMPKGEERRDQHRLADTELVEWAVLARVTRLYA